MIRDTGGYCGRRSFPVGAPLLPSDEINRILARGVRTLQKEIGTEIVLGGAITSRRQDGIAIRVLAGTLGRSLYDLQVASGCGLGGKAFALRRPVAVEDYLTGRIVHTYDDAVAPEKIVSAIALPVQIDGSPRGLLYLAHRSSIEFGTACLDRAVAVVRRLERDIRVEEEVRARVEAETARLRVDMQRRALSLGELGDLRAELDQLMSIVDDNVRERLRSISARLSSVVAGAGRGIASPAAAVTPREVEVLSAVASGLSNRAAATALGLMPNTVKSYLHSAARKLGASNRVEAVNNARAGKLI